MAQKPSWTVAWALASLNLAFPAAFLFLLRPILLGYGHVGNLPSMIERGAVASVFVAAALALVARQVRIGMALTWTGVALNIALILWFWLDSGVVFTLEIGGWLVVDAMILLVLLFARSE